MKSVALGTKKIGDGNPCFIIAEMAWSHDGSIDKAMKIVSGAAAAKADAICIHLTSVKDYMTQDYGLKHGVSIELGQETVYQYLDRVNLKNEEWEKIVSAAKKHGLSVCAMCNDIASIEFASSMNVDAYIIPPASVVEEALVKKVGKQHKPVMIRIGGATIDEIKQNIRWLSEAGNQEIVLIHGFQSFPTPLEEMHVAFIDTLKKTFGFPVGFADHVDAESDLSSIIPLIAVGAGANAIEKHLTHNRSLKGEDFESAMNPDEFSEFVSILRETEVSSGSAEFRELSEKEKKYRLMSRKRVVAAKDIEKGHIISVSDINFKRSNEGIYPDEIKNLIGKKAAIKILKDAGITKEMVL